MARVGLVLGAGGVTGGAFHAGVLSAVEEVTGWDPRNAEVVVGTSAGAVTAASLRAGLGAADIAARVEGRPVSAEGRLLLDAAGLAAGPPPAPAGRMGRAGWNRPSAPEVLIAAARRPWTVRPTALAAGLLPEGGIPTTAISEGIDALLGGRWPARDLWLAAVRLDRGRLVVFGRQGAPAATPGQAVAASCAIPGWFAPVTIGGNRYVDGGAHSLTNVEQLVGVPLDVVVVCSPMSHGRQLAQPRPLEVEQGRRLPPYFNALRRVAGAQLAVELRGLRRRNVPVLVFQPTLDDQAVMGADPMDPETRAPVVRQARRSTITRLRQTRQRAILALLAEG